jgi:hypothetical protein
MEVLDYSIREPAGRDPRVGRLAAACLVLFVALYALVLILPDPKGLIALNVECAFLMLLSGFATLASIIAVCRRPNRTRLSWVVFSICMAWWIFYVLAFLGD